jgi:hypothetical protein
MTKRNNTIIEDASTLLWMEDGIIFFEYKPDTVVNLEVQKKNIEDRISLSEGIPRPILADCRGIKYWTREAKAYSLTPESQKLVKAIAMVQGNYIHTITWNFAMKFMKPVFPTRVFNDISSALAWLQKFK